MVCRPSNRLGAGRATSMGVAMLAIAGLGVLPGGAHGQGVSESDLRELRAIQQRQQDQFAAQAGLLRQQGEQLSAQRQQIDAQRREIEQLRRAVGQRPTGGGAAPAAIAQGSPVVTGGSATPPSTPAIAPAAGGAPSGERSAAGTAVSNPTAEREQQRQQESRIVESNIGMSRSSGVLTPRGTLVVTPSLEYEFLTQRQAVVSGFTIIPGITFGNINIVKTQQRILTAATTFRAGLTDRLEVNVRVPYVAEWGTTTTANVGVNARPLTVGATGYDLGDIEAGGSYQLNEGHDGWPIFIGNLRLKTTTGRDPFSVPIVTVNDFNGTFLRGVQKQLPTGTGFYSLEPSLTMIYPSDPVVVFGNVRYIANFGRSVNLQNDAGGPPIHTRLDPGSAVGFNFGMGFGINENMSFSLGYEHIHAFPSSANSKIIGGSDYDVGSFTFGLGYQLSQRVSVNLGVGIGVTPDTPTAKILLSIPIKLNLF